MKPLGKGRWLTPEDSARVWATTQVPLKHVRADVPDAVYEPCFPRDKLIEAIAKRLYRIAGMHTAPRDWYR
jgi:hypothetical protein